MSRAPAAALALAAALGGVAGYSRAVADPPRVPPLVHPASKGDGAWRGLEAWTGRPAPLLVTSLRLSPGDPSQVAYLAWIRARRTQLALYPGYKGPGPSPLPRGPEQVPPRARSRLVATFNSGFYEKDSAGGFYVNHLLYAPMIRGRGTVVAYRNGTVDVLSWRGRARPGPGVIVARQNLPLIVYGGRPNPALDVSLRWGDTLHGAPAVWRTGLGIDRGGNLVYLAAPDQTAPSLARLLIRAGAVRAMELDINPAWPVFVAYGSRGAGRARLVVANPLQVPSRFLSPSLKDFFAVYLRTAPTDTGVPY